MSCFFALWMFRFSRASITFFLTCKKDIPLPPCDTMTEIPGLKRSERLATCSNAGCSAAIPTVSAPDVAVYVPDAPTKLWAQERTRTQGTARIEQEENYRSLASISIL